MTRIPRLAAWFAAALLTVTAPAAVAQEIEFFTDHPQTAIYFGNHVYLHNLSAEPLRDLVVELQLAPGLEFSSPREPSTLGDDWSCERTATAATCRLTTFAPERTDLFGFVLVSTDPSGGHRTARATLTASNLPTPKSVDFDVITDFRQRVTTADDFGPGSLRAAIEAANANPLCGTDVPCNIYFNTSLTIAPLSPLPAIRKCHVHLIGPLELGPKSVIITGERASHGNGLEVRASCTQNIAGVTIQSIGIHSWPWNGIYFEAPEAHTHSSSHAVHNCHIGTDPTGSFARPNRSRGIVTDSPHEVIGVSSSIISGNGRSGIALFRGKSASISSCKIGTDIRLGPLPNGASGVFSAGVPVMLHSNVLAYNAHAGLAFTPGTRVFATGPIFSNGGLPIDANIDGRTPDDDEHDGVLNAPRITDAFYNPASNLTTIRGVVRLRAGAFGTVHRIIGHLAFGERGDPAEPLEAEPAMVEPPADGSAGDVAFEMVAARDLRGNFVSLQTFAGANRFGADVVSEVSEGVVVR